MYEISVSKTEEVSERWFLFFRRRVVYQTEIYRQEISAVDMPGLTKAINSVENKEEDCFTPDILKDMK